MEDFGVNRAGGGIGIVAETLQGRLANFRVMLAMIV
jgi:hypothetical protein